ncbi:MAG: hypothetical protein RI928_2125 [Pseudomonadota bacterium]
MTIVRTSLMGGLCLAGFHLLWVLLVFLGWAQPFIDFVLQLHMMDLPLTVQPFQLSRAVGLVGLAFLAGCFYGWLFYLLGKSSSTGRFLQ